MKRLILVLILCLFSSFAHAQGMQPVGGVTVVAASCTSQTITWGTNPSAMTVGDSDQTLTGDATASSSLTVTYTNTNNAAICTIVSGKLHAVGAGTCVVHADQAGNGTYCAAPQANSGNVTISGGAGARASFALDAVGTGGNAGKVYDAIAASWVGSGCNTADFSSGYLVAASSSALCLIPGQYLNKNGSYNAITIAFEYQASAADSGMYLIRRDYGGGVGFNVQDHYYGPGQMAGEVSYSYWTGNWTELASYNTWIKFQGQIDFVAHTATVKLNTTTPPTGWTTTTMTNLIDWGDLTGSNINLCLTPATTVCRLRNLHIYNGAVWE